MARGLKNRNLVATIRALARYGGQLVEVISTGKHHKVRAVTRLGNRAQFTVSRGPVEPYKLLGWTRQALNQADALAEQKKGKK